MKNKKLERSEKQEEPDEVEAIFPREEFPSSSKTEQSNWWVTDFGKKTAGKSVSSYWTSRVDYSWYDYSDSLHKSFNQSFAKILKSIHRSANVTMNASDSSSLQGERELTVKWAQNDGDRNSALGDQIFLSPDVVNKETTMRPSWSDDERTDVLIGEALIQSTMKRTIDPSVEKDMCERAALSKKQRLESEVWTSLEHLFAEKEVLSMYPGFKGYFAANRAYYTEETSKVPFEKAAAENPTAEQAVTAFVWEMLHPSEKLSLPKDMEDFIEWSKRRVEVETSSLGRSEASKEIVGRAFEIWKHSKESKKFCEGVIPGLYPGVGLSETNRNDAIEFNTGIVDKHDDGEYDSVVTATRLPASLSECNYRKGTIIQKITPSHATKEKYVKDVARLQSSINGVRNKMRLRNEEFKNIEHGLKRGRIDEGSLYKLGFSKMDFKDEKIFEMEEIISKPKVAFGLLVDESGSMSSAAGSYGSGGFSKSRISVARDVAIVFANACLGLHGVDMSVWGHTGDGRYSGSSTRGLALHEYYTPDNPSMESMADITYYSNNIDGYAIATAAKKMIEFYPNHDRRILIHISDGEPCAGDYYGMLAMQHIGRVGKLCEEEGVRVVGIGVCDAFSDSEGRVMYGSDFAVIDGVSGLQNIITNLIVRSVNTPL